MKRKIEEQFARLGGIMTFDPPMTEEELSAIERNLGEHLPEDYRELVRAYGVAMFGAETWFRPVQSLSISPSQFREMPSRVHE